MTTGPTPTARPSLNDLVAAEIRAQMGRRGMAMNRLAEALGVSEAWTTRHLSARSAVQSLTFDELERIAAALDVSPLHLIPKDFQPGARTGRHTPRLDECRPIVTRPRPEKPTKSGRLTSRHALVA